MNLREKLRVMRPAGSVSGRGEARSGAVPTGATPVGEAHADPIATDTTATDAIRAGTIAPGTPVSPTVITGSSRRRAPLPLGRGLVGRELDTSAGPAYCIEGHYPLDFRRGPVPLASAARVDASAWQRWLGQDADGTFSADRTAFLDVETTGLERGTGTYAFLIGIGRFVDGAFRIRQFFMRDYDEEPAVLEAVRRELEGTEGLFTFNGRSFDWPLLQTRATLNRQTFPDPVHVDLLYPARRLWKPVTGDCRLSRLEEAVLGLAREGDVPGYLIPRLYFQYLQTGDGRPLKTVIDHNRQDLLTTVALAAYLGEAVSEPLQAAPLGRPLPGSDLLAIGRLMLDRQEPAQAVACLEEALRRGLPEGLRGECRRLLARAHRRLGRERAAAEQWHALVHDAGVSVEPYVELAKYYEHKAKDLIKAREWTLRAMDVLQRRRLLRLTGLRNPWSLSSEPDPAIQALTHRLRRLDRKLSRGGRESVAAGSVKSTPLF